MRQEPWEGRAWGSSYPDHLLQNGLTAAHSYTGTKTDGWYDTLNFEHAHFRHVSMCFKTWDSKLDEKVSLARRALLRIIVMVLLFPVTESSKWFLWSSPTRQEKIDGTSHRSGLVAESSPTSRAQKSPMGAQPVGKVTRRGSKAVNSGRVTADASRALRREGMRW